MNTLTVFPKRGAFAPISFNHILNDILNDDFFNHKSAHSSTPLVNIKETENGFQLEVAAPGMNKENFNITVENDLLTISAEKQTEQKETTEKFTRREFAFTSFKRSFTLPENVATENIKASYENGILKIDLMKKSIEKSETKKVVIS